jgi:hypothetical protein
MPRVRVLCRLKGSADTVGFDMGLVSRVRPRGVSPPPGHLRCRSRRYVLRVGLVKKTSEGSFVPRRLARPDRREVGRSELRKLPQYEQSEEFKANTAQFRSGYQQIYGTPDAAGEQKITEAARAGWNGDQWMKFLRNQPEYKTSGEFQRNVYSLMANLGFTTPGVTAPLAAHGPQAPTPAPSPTATGSAPSV